MNLLQNAWNLGGVLCHQYNRYASHAFTEVVQDIIAMAFTNYHRALEKGKKLSVGELVKFMQYRLSQLKSGLRRPFGSRLGTLARMYSASVTTSVVM